RVATGKEETNRVKKKIHICQPLCALWEAGDLVSQAFISTNGHSFGLVIDRCTGYAHLCDNYLTHCARWVLWFSMTTSAKREPLLASGTLNPHPEAVRSALFHVDFFDPYDFAQVKYEVLRAHSVREH